MTNVIGIYEIRCTDTNRVYIGKSINIPRRWKIHVRYLNRGKHENVVLQRAWKKYGKDKFTFSVIEYTNNPEELSSKENKWITKYKSNHNQFGFNLLDGSVMKEYNWGRNNGRNTTDEETVHHVCELIESGKNNTEIAKTCKVSKSVVSSIRCGEAWTHITDEYELHPSPSNFKLGKRDVIEIISLVTGGMEIKQIADRFGVGPNAISDIISGRSWSQATDGGINTGRRKDKPKAKLSEGDVLKIRNIILSRKATHKAIAKMFGVSIGAIGHIKHGTTWKDVYRSVALDSSELGLNHILSENDALNIKKRLSAGESASSIWNDYQNISVAAIYRIWYGSSWKEVGENINLPTPKVKTRLKAETIRNIRDMIANGMGNREISNVVNTSIANIQRIKRGATWPSQGLQ